MNPSVLPTIAALLGTIIGGLTSFLTSWYAQKTQTRAQRLAAAKNKREELYGRFLDEMTRLYARAFAENRVDYSALVDIFALKGRIALVGSQPVVQMADFAVKHILDIYMGPNLDIVVVRGMLDEIDTKVVRKFAETCRAELEVFEIP